MAKRSNNMLGAWAFLIGVILAVIAGVAGLLVNSGWTTSLVIIGIIIGLLNIGGSELKEFMLAGTVLVIVSAMGSGTLGLVRYVGEITTALLILFVPATIVVALKTIFALAKN